MGCEVDIERTGAMRLNSRVLRTNRSSRSASSAIVSSSSRRSSGSMRDHDDNSVLRGRLHGGEWRAQVVAHGRQEAGALATDLSEELRVAYLVLQAHPVDRGGDAADERFEQRAITCFEPVLGGGDQLDVADLDVHVGRGAERAGERVLTERAQLAAVEFEEVAERVRRIGQGVVDIASGEQSIRELELHDGFALAAQRNAPQRREPLHGPVNERGRPARTR